MESTLGYIMVVTYFDDTFYISRFNNMGDCARYAEELQKTSIKSIEICEIIGRSKLVMEFQG